MQKLRFSVEKWPEWMNLVNRWTGGFVILFFEIFFNILILFLRGTEGQSMSRGGAEREGDTECEAGSRLRAVSTEPDVRLDPTNYEIMT